MHFLAHFYPSFIQPDCLLTIYLVRSLWLFKVRQGCICKFEKVREIPHLTPKTAGFWNFCAGFLVRPKTRFFFNKHKKFPYFLRVTSPLSIDFLVCFSWTKLILALTGTCQWQWLVCYPSAKGASQQNKIVKDNDPALVLS